jgi:hypothetical protein
MNFKIGEIKETIGAKPGKKKKEKKEKNLGQLNTKGLNIVTLDLEKNNNQTVALSNVAPESLKLETTQLNSNNQVKEEKESLANIDLLYLTNQHRFFKSNNIDTLLSNNYLLKTIYNNLDENINCFKDEIIKYNSLNLKELLENNGYSEGQEKHKLFYLLYVLNLIVHLKEQKIQNLICEDLKDYSNNYKTSKSNEEEETINTNFNIINETLKLMSSSASSSKKLTNIDLMVTKKSNNNNKKILPQKWE